VIIGLLVIGLLVVGGGAVALWKLRGRSASSAKRPQKLGTTAAPVSSTSATPEVPDGMALIPGGTYTIGCDQGTPGCFADERPAHQVELDAFAIDEREVTREAYAKCVEKKRCAPLLTTAECGGAPNDPVRCVDWRAAMAFCDFRGARLPTETEWEAAARGPKAFRHPWGSDPLGCDNAIIRDERGPGCGSGGLKANGHAEDVSPFGVRNMAGNVREWTSTPYAAYPGGKARKLEGHYVNRGGSFALTAEEAGASHTRIADKPETRRPDLGLRCAAYLTR
jgi:iron(II)-dependent oxidoreductase